MHSTSVDEDGGRCRCFDAIAALDLHLLWSRSFVSVRARRDRLHEGLFGRAAVSMTSSLVDTLLRIAHDRVHLFSVEDDYAGSSQGSVSRRDRFSLARRDRVRRWCAVDRRDSERHYRMTRARRKKMAEEYMKKTPTGEGQVKVNSHGP